MKSIILLAAILTVATANTFDLKHLNGLRAKQLLNDILHNHDRLNQTRQLTVTVNEYMDLILKEVTEYAQANNLDPTELADIETGFSQKLGLITITGELKLTDGSIYDLSKVERLGDCVLRYDNLFLHVQVPVSFKSLLAKFDYSAKFLNLGPTGGIEGTVKNTKVSIDILIDLKELQLYLQNFNIDSMGKIDVKFTGNILTDWIANLMSDVVTTVLHGLFESVLNKNVVQIIQSIIDKINENIHDTFG